MTSEQATPITPETNIYTHEMMVRAQKRLAEDIAKLTAEMKRWQELYSNDELALYAFGRAQDAIDAAAKLYACKLLLSHIELIGATTDGSEKPVTWESVANYIAGRWHDKVMRNALYPPRSTSAMSNLVEQAEAQAAAWAIDRYFGLW